ncbi:hypothetical protein Fmac_004501 [Flemingia macrophylla]|uniref:NADP-dependent oxidoreductase domain-containing protein n=1 Tax=Flemingia macrophylla TaxID=520843 RepID=A0ABD1N5R1_9FABA
MRWAHRPFQFLVSAVISARCDARRGLAVALGSVSLCLGVPLKEEEVAAKSENNKKRNKKKKQKKNQQKVKEEEAKNIGRRRRKKKQKAEGVKEEEREIAGDDESCREVQVAATGKAMEECELERRWRRKREEAGEMLEAMSGVALFNLAPNLSVSRLCLGTMTFGEQNTLSDSYRLLDQAFHAGINFFDSAEMYPVPQRPATCGRSEEYLARWIKQRHIPRDRLVIATKVAGPSAQMTWIRGGPKCLDAANITQAIDDSLLRMQMDYIDLYQIHWPDRYVPMFGEIEYDPVRQYFSISIEEQLEALSTAVKAGKASGSIRYIGLSNETPYGLMKFIHVAEKYASHLKIVSLQNSYSLLCRTFDSAMAECCHQESVSLLAYSPLAMGILSGKYFSSDGGPTNARLNLFKGRYAEGDSRYNLSNKFIREATMEYLNIAKKYGLHPVSLAIAFVLRHPLVASVIFGATKSWQLREVLNACKIELTSEVIEEINMIHSRFPNPCP